MFSIKSGQLIFLLVLFITTRFGEARATFLKEGRSISLRFLSR